MNKADWLNIIERGEWATLDDRWMAAIDDSVQEREILTAVLAAVVAKGQAERAGTMAWLWLSTVKERSSAAPTLALAREILLTVDTAQLRTQVAELYREVYSDRPQVEKLIEASGLTGNKTPRRALRTLEVGLHAVPGAFVVSRSEDTPAEVVQVDLAADRFVLQTPGRRLERTADQLGVDFDPVDANDFRVLSTLRTERLAQLLESDPVEVLIGILRARGGKIDSDELKYLLTPRHLSADAWGKWWSRLRNALKRQPNVRVEGRNPVVLSFDETGRTLEDEFREKWSLARTPEEKLAVVEAYAREAKSRRAPMDASMLRTWGSFASARVAQHGNTPVEAMRWAVVADRLRQLDPAAPESAGLVKSVLLRASRPVDLVREFLESSLIHSLLDEVRAEMPDRWEPIFLELLPASPPAVCDVIVGHLVDAGQTEAVQAIIQQIASRPQDSLRIMAWLFRGPACAGRFACPPRLELMTRMLTLLGDLSRNESESAETVKEARAIIKAALSHRKYEVFREVMSGIDLELARTVYRQIERAPGLSKALMHDLAKIAREVFPDLFVEVRHEPWVDPNVIYTTEEGLQKAQKELDYLVNVKMAENAKAIGAAAALGDLSENSEYKFALEERDLLRARVSKLQNEINMARVLKPHFVPRNLVSVGTRVKVRSEDGAVEQEMRFLGPWDSDVARHVYNYQAPLSQKLMGLTVGDTAELSLDGTVRVYRIESIDLAV